MIIGITGGTGCGKTTALEVLREAGASVLDCDRIYHRLLETDQAMLDAISQRFPGTVNENILDRKKLGSIVFADKAALSDLNAITHGAVKQVVVEQITHLPHPIAIDAIGLFEGGLAPLCDVTIAVLAPREDRIRRLMQREGISAEYARSRIDAQPPQERFSQLCDHTLTNDTTAQQFREKCLAFFQELGMI